MLILIIIAIALCIALLRGGSLLNLLNLPLRWNGIAAAGLILQLLIFTPFSDTPLIATATPQLYIVSMLLLVVWIAANYRIPGAILLAAGLLSNLAAIVANGGYMPVAPHLAEYTGQIVRYEGETALIENNSIASDNVQLWLLTDILAVPPFIPFANVFSIGDVLLVVGGSILVYRGAFGGAAAAPAAAQSSDTIAVTSPREEIL
jgi:hypothetical protein